MANDLLTSVSDLHGVAEQEMAAAIKGSILPKSCSEGDWLAFLMTCKSTGLNPLTREIYALPKKGGGIQSVISIDGFLKLMNQHPDFDGLETESVDDANGNLEAVTCRIYRKDRSRPTTCTEYLRECRRNSEPWKQWPARMLRHRAIAQCARMAFELSGVMERDEAEAFTQDAPAAVKVPASASGIDKAKALIQPQEAPEAPSVTFAQFIDRMDEAKSIEELREVAKQIPEHIKEQGQLDELRDQFEGFAFNLKATTE